MQLPKTLDDHISEDTPVQVVEAFVDRLDLAALRFVTVPEATGRPGVHPGVMLRIFAFGCLDQVPSPRWPDRNCACNLGLIPLPGRLLPDCETIAAFREENGPSIRKLCQQFVVLCRDMSLLDHRVLTVTCGRF